MYSAKIKSSKFYDVEKSANSMVQTVYGFSKSFAKTSPMLGLQVILQVDYTPEADGTALHKPVIKTLGWCSMPLFKETDQSETPNLRVGNFKVFLRPGAFNSSFLRMKSKAEDATAENASDDLLLKPALHFRIRHAGKPVEPFSIEPTMTQHLYKFPSEKDEEVQKDEDAAAKRKSRKRGHHKRKQKGEDEMAHADSTMDAQGKKEAKAEEVGEEVEQEGSAKKEGDDEDDDDDDLDGEQSTMEEAGEGQAESSLNSNVSVVFHRLEVLPHAQLEDKPLISLSVDSMIKQPSGDKKEQSDTKYESVFVSKPAKAKSNEHSITYSLKKQAVTVTTSPSMSSLRLNAVAQGAGDEPPLFRGVLKLLDNRGTLINGEQQVQLRSDPDDEEPAALLSVVVSDESVARDNSDAASQSSRVSRRSLKGKNARSSKPQPPIDEEEDELARSLEIDSQEEDSEEPWIKFENSSPPLPFDKSADGVDVYIDGARSLPDNCTVTKIVLRNMTKNNKDFNDETGGEVGFCALDGPLLSPKYTLRKEYRSEHFDPTSTLLIRVDTVDKYSSNTRVVGYALLNLFTEVDDRSKQPDDTNSQEFCLNAGAFQLPLRKQSPSTKDKKFSASKLDSAKRVSCATVLVRIVPAPKNDLGCKSRSDYEDPATWVKEGLDVPAPEYSSSAYDSMRCIPLPIEQKLYEIRRFSSPGIFTKEYVYQQLLKKYGEDKDSKDIEAKEYTEFISNAVGMKPGSYLDYTFMNKLDLNTGFKVAIDGLHRMKAGGVFSSTPFYKVMYLLSPPAMFYETGGSMTDEVEFTRQYDLSSDQTSPKFLDKFFEYKNLATESESMALILEVRSITVKKKEKVVSGQGESLWAALPIFKQEDKNYVDSGCFCIPTFEGKVPPAMVGSNAPDDVYEWICNELKKPKKESPAVHLNYGGSVILRLVDGFVDEFQEPQGAASKISMKYVQQVCAAAGKSSQIYDYDPQAAVGKKTIAKLCGSNQEQELIQVNKAMAGPKGLGLSDTHYTFD